MSITTPKRNRCTIEFTPADAESLRSKAREDSTTAAELVRRAINFYELKLDAKRNHKRISLESPDGTKEWVLL